MKKISAIFLFLAALFGVQSAWAAGTYTGDRRALCIYMSFADASVTTADEWTRQLNGIDYKPNGGVGSVRDYFYDMSYGQFNLQFDCLPYTVSGNRSTYAATSASTNTGKFAPALTAALNGLYSSGALTDEMIARYDWDNDGYVDQVVIIYAGPAGQNMSQSGYIRSHESEMTTLTLGGKKFSTYAACAETRTDLKTIDGIGGVTHEIVHCFGLPDFYGTYGNSQAQTYTGMDGFWDLMDLGTYNGDNYNGTIPPQMTSFERWVAGWLTPVVLDENTDVTAMRPMMEAAEAYVVYNKESAAVSGSIAKFPEGGQYKEFFLLENRKSNSSFGGNGRTWDSPIGTFNGMLVVHVDFNESQWNSTSPNGTVNHQRMTIVPADGTLNNAYSNYISSSLAGDLWTSGTVKPMDVFNGASPLECSIGGISVQSDGTINFTYATSGKITEYENLNMEAGYYAATSQDEIKAGETFLMYQPYGWFISHFYTFDVASWLGYGACKSVDSGLGSSPASYNGEVNKENCPTEFMLEDAGDGKFYIKDLATGKYLYVNYGPYGSSNRYSFVEGDNPAAGEPWTIEYSEDYADGEFYVTTRANGQTLYLRDTNISSISMGQNWVCRTTSEYDTTLRLLRKLAPSTEAAAKGVYNRIANTAAQAGKVYTIFNYWGWTPVEWNGSNAYTAAALGDEGTVDYTNGNYDGSVNATGRPTEFLFEDAGEGKFYVKDLATGKYVYASSRTALAQSDEVDAANSAYKWSVVATGTDGNEVEIVTSVNGSNAYIDMKNSSDWSSYTFTAQTSGSFANIYLYERVAGQKVVTEGTEEPVEPGPEPEKVVYTKAQTSADVKDGDTILLINDNGYAYGLYDSYYGSTATVTVSLTQNGTVYDGNVNASGLPYELTLEATDGGYYIKDGGKYIYATPGDSSDFYYVDLGTAAQGLVWNFDIVDGVANITSTLDGVKLWLTMQHFTDGATDYTIRPYSYYTIGVFVKGTGEGGEIVEPEPEPEPVEINTEGTYVRITSPDQLQSGDEVLFVYEAGSLAMGDVMAEGYNFAPVSVSVSGGVYTGAVNAEGAPYGYIIDRDGDAIYFQQAVSQKWISESNDGTYSYMTLDDASALDFNVTVDANGTAALNFTSFKGNAMFVTYYASYADFEFSMTSWGDKPNFAIYKRLELGENDRIAFAAPSQYSVTEETPVEAYRNSTAAPAVDEPFLILSENGWWGMTNTAANVSVAGPGHDNDYKDAVDGADLLGTFTRTAEGYLLSSNGKYLTVTASGSGNRATYSLSYSDAASTVWTFATNGQYQRLSARVNNRNVYLSSPTAERGGFSMTTSSRNVSIFRYIDKIVQTNWYDVPALAIQVEQGAAAICAADAYQLPEGLTASYIAQGEGGLVKTVHYEAGDIVPAATPVLIEGESGLYNARVYNMTESGTMTIVYGDENLLEGTRDERGYTASARADVSYYGLCAGESGYGFYGADDDCSAFPIAEGLAYLAVAEQVRGYLLPDLSVAPYQWIGNVILPEEVAAIDDLLNIEVEFQYAESVTTSGFGVLGVIYEANGNPYAVVLDGQFGGVEYDGSVATVTFQKIADLNENLQKSVRNAVAARVGNVKTNGSARLYICGKSFRVNDELYVPAISRDYDCAGGTITGIESLTTSQTERLYDLSGRRVRTNARGIFVGSGIKVIR